MPKLSREYLLASVLAGIAAVLGLLLALEWIVLAKDRERALAAPRVKAETQVEIESGNALDFELPPLDDFRQMTERPLFMENRRPGAEPTETVAAPPPQTPMNLKLMGIVFTPEGKKALLVDAKGKYKRLKAQDTLDSWTLVEVDQDKVVMQQGEERKELPLLKKKPKLASGAQQPPPGGQPPRPQGRPPMPPPQQVPGEDMGDEGADALPEDEEDSGAVEEDTGTDE